MPGRLLPFALPPTLYSTYLPALDCLPAACLPRLPRLRCLPAPAVLCTPTPCPHPCPAPLLLH